MRAAGSQIQPQYEYFAPPSSSLRDFPLAPLVPLVLFTDQHKKYSQRPGGALGGRSWGCEMPKMCLNLTQAPRGVSRGARSLRSGYGRHHTPHPACGGYVCCYMAVLAGPCGICNAPRGRVSPGDAPWALGTAQSVQVRSDVPLVTDTTAAPPGHHRGASRGSHGGLVIQHSAHTQSHSSQQTHGTAGGRRGIPPPLGSGREIASRSQAGPCLAGAFVLKHIHPSHQRIGLGGRSAIASPPRQLGRRGGVV